MPQEIYRRSPERPFIGHHHHHHRWLAGSGHVTQVRAYCRANPRIGRSYAVSHATTISRLAAKAAL